jgi:hypothetical protein
LISLTFGGDFSLFQPDVPCGHEEYEFRILTRQFQFFGPFSTNYHEIVDNDTIEVVLWFMEQFPKDQMVYFPRIAEHQISKEDNEFVR